MEIKSIVERFVSLGYDITFEGVSGSYIELFKSFNNEFAIVDGDKEIQIGRKIEIYDNIIRISSYMKRGYLWSGSAYTVGKHNYVYAIGKTYLIELC
jgi:hypothetical protein